jgi:hypothetical protein
LADPERFERPTPRFVVWAQPQEIKAKWNGHSFQSPQESEMILDMIPPATTHNPGDRVQWHTANGEVLTGTVKDTIGNLAAIEVDPADRASTGGQFATLPQSGLARLPGVM